MLSNDYRVRPDIEDVLNGLQYLNEEKQNEPKGGKRNIE